MSRLEDDLRQVLPSTDFNGDEIALVPRKDVFRLLWGLIQPITARFNRYEHSGNGPAELRLSADEEVQAGRARQTAGLNTEQDREAYLECWWPKAADGACVTYTAQRGAESGLPYPEHTMLRSASILLRLTPTLVFGTMRLGVAHVTTTLGRALWDVGIRRALMHPTDHYYQWLVQQGHTARLVPLADNDPMRIWTSAPGQTTRAGLAFYLDLSTRPVTRDLAEWRKGTP